MSQRAVVSDGVIANEVVEYRIAQGGFVHDIIRALVAVDGVALEYWPPAGDGTDPNILFTDDEITSRQQTLTPTDCQATINFVRGNGFYFYDNHPETVQSSAKFLDPNLDGTAGDDGKFLIRLDVISGTFLVDPTGVWIDLNSQTQVRWFIEQTTVGTSTGEADISIAADDGGGSPVATTTVVKRVNFFAEVVPLNFIAWTSAQRDLVEIKEGIDATCALLFDSDGSATGQADTSGSFSEDWHRLAPLASPAVGFTVQVDVISGTAPSGSALGTALALNDDYLWVLTATSGEDLSNELDVTVSNGTDSVVKRITMNSVRNDVASDLVLQTNPQVVSDTGLNEAVTGGLIIRVNGELVGTSDSSSPSFLGDDIFGILAEQWNEDWHADSPAATDAASYEAKLEVSGDQPTSGAPVGVFVPCNFELAWFWGLPAAPPPAILTANCTLTMQLLGAPSTAISKPIFVQVNVEQEGP